MREASLRLADSVQSSEDIRRTRTVSILASLDPSSERALRAFVRIRSKSTRKEILQLIQAIANGR